MRKIKIIAIIFGVIIFSGCSNKTDTEKLDYDYDTTNTDITFRVNSLYEHTKIMIQLSDDEQLEKINLDKSFIGDEIFLGIENKVKIMESSYGIADVSDDLDVRVELLESRMDEMMRVWNRE